MERRTLGLGILLATCLAAPSSQAQRSPSGPAPAPDPATARPRDPPRDALQTRVDDLIARAAALRDRYSPTPTPSPSPDAFPAGTTLSSKVGISRHTTWEEIQRALRQLFRAYTDQDLLAFQASFAPAASQAVAIFTNAIQDDFQTLTNLSLNIELRQFFPGTSSSQVEFFWSRTATETRTGTTRFDRGSATVLLVRDGRYRVLQFTGRVPFGLADAAVLQQTRAGATTEPALLVDGTPPATPAPTPAPPAVERFTLDILLDPNGQNVAAVDFEARSVRRTSNPSPPSTTPQPGEDLLFSTTPFTSNFVDLTGVQGGQVSPCGGATATFSDLRDVTEASLGTASDTNTGAFFGGKTAEGRFYFVNVLTNQQVSVTLGQTSALVDPDGTVTCP